MTNTMTKEERLQNIIDDTNEWDVLSWWNDMCDTYRDSERYIVPMGEFDDMFYGMKASEVVRAIENADHFSINDEWFIDGIYGLESFDDLYDVMDDDELITYIIDEDEDFGDDRIREVLDSEDEEEDED